MSLTSRFTLALIALAPLFLTSCASTGSAAPFESNASFRLMLYG